MIKYKLSCKNCEISFDSWFASSKEYEKLKKKSLLNIADISLGNLLIFGSILKNKMSFFYYLILFYLS